MRGAFNPAACRFGEEVLLLLRVAEDVPAEEGRVSVPVVDFSGGTARPDVLSVRRDDPEVTLRDTRGLRYRGVEYLSTMSHLRIARSRDGVAFTVDETPFLLPEDPSERFGVEDARITQIGGTYWINYTAVSADGWATALASTTDFASVERHGIIFPPANKDVSIFPGKTAAGRYAALHRPNNDLGKASVWYAESGDLRDWGGHRCILRPREGVAWESAKIGGGGPCVETDAGWLQLYHAKDADSRYTLALALLDRDEPWRVLKRSTRPVFEPEEPFETDGFFGNVVFTNGWVQDGDRLLVYYGAADESVGVAETTVEELLATLE